MGDYYHDHAEEYIASSMSLDMQEVYPLFLSRLQGKEILDVGFGSGRDMLYFKRLGYEVEGIDPEVAFVDHARKEGLEVYQAGVLDFTPLHLYDGIWSCASLLHLPKADIVLAVKRMKEWLSKNGILFISLKEGEEEGVDEKGRVMTYVDSSFLESLGMEVLSITEDAGGRSIRWINAVYRNDGE